MALQRARPGGPYDIPDGPAGVDGGHALVNGLRSLWIPGVFGGGRRLYNLAPEQAHLGAFIEAQTAANTPVMRSGVFGPMSLHTGVNTGGMYQRAGTPAWNPPLTTNSFGPGTIAAMATVEAGPAGGNYPAIYGFSETTGSHYLAFAPTSSGDVLLSVNRRIDAPIPAEPTIGTWAAGHTLLMIGSTNGWDSHIGYLLNLTTGALTTGASTTDITWAGSGASAVAYENVGGADYGTQYYLNGRIGMAAFWGRQFTPAEMLDFLRSPFDMLFPRGRVARGLSLAGANYTLTADSSSFTLSGQSAGVLRGRTLTADAAACSLTGISAGLLYGRPLVAATGTFALAGQAAGLVAGRGLPADPGAFSLSGAAAGLLYGRVLAADAGAFALTGGAAGLSVAKGLLADLGVFNLTGVAAGLTAVRRLGADTAGFDLAGQDAGVIYTPVGGYSLSADGGAFGLLGQTAGLPYGRQMAADAAALALAGQAAGLLVARALTAAIGTFTVAGQAAGTPLTRRIAADTATVVLTGADAALVYQPVGAFTVVADAGQFSGAGQDAVLRAARTLQAGLGSIALTATDAALTRGRAVVADPAAFTLSVPPAGLVRTARLQADAFPLDFTGNPAGLSYTPVGTFNLLGATGAIALVGHPAGLIRNVLDVVIPRAPATAALARAVSTGAIPRGAPTPAVPR